ncbi:hypothetical protein TNCV_494351 [Trichonephila clavipes]|nr:hypothetical protein TNCV_494351 [Trichonephila clavipes]
MLFPLPWGAKISEKGVEWMWHLFPFFYVIKVLWNGAKDSLEDDARPGLAHRVITPEMITEVNALVSWTTAESSWMRSIGYWVSEWAPLTL